MATKKVMTVYELLNIIQTEMNAPKNRYNKFGKYNYRSCEDILQGVKPYIREHGGVILLEDDLVFVEGEVVREKIEDKSTTVVQSQESSGEAPGKSQEKGNNAVETTKISSQGRFYVKATATLVGPDGEKVSVSALAREPEKQSGMQDNQLTGATSTYARKYALNGLLAIDDSVDPDSDETKEIEKSATKKAPVKKTTTKSTASTKKAETKPKATETKEGKVEAPSPKKEEPKKEESKEEKKVEKKPAKKTKMDAVAEEIKEGDDSEEAPEEGAIRELFEKYKDETNPFIPVLADPELKEIIEGAKELGRGKEVRGIIQKLKSEYGPK